MFSQFFPEIKVKVKEAGLRPSPPSSPGFCWESGLVGQFSEPASQAPVTWPGLRAKQAQLPSSFLPGGKLRREGKREKG